MINQGKKTSRSIRANRNCGFIFTVKKAQNNPMNQFAYSYIYKHSWQI